MVEELSIYEILKILKKRMSTLINITLLGLILSAIYTFFLASPSYSSTTQLLVNRTESSEVIQRSDIDTNVQLINTYSDIIRNPVILDTVIEEINLNLTSDELKSQINVTTENNSQVFSVQIVDENPYNAAEIANTIATVFQENLNSIMNVDNITVISEATANIHPIAPNNIMNLAIGLLAGIVISLGLVFAIEFLDNSVKDEKFIVDELGWVNLGNISKMSKEDLKDANKKVYIHNRNEERTTRSRV